MIKAKGTVYVQSCFTVTVLTKLMLSKYLLSFVKHMHVSTIH